MAERRQQRVEHKRNEEKKRETSVDETAPATPPPEPKMELGEEVVVQCSATHRLEESRPIVSQGLALDDIVGMRDTVQFLISSLSKGHVFLCLKSGCPVPSSQSSLTTEHDLRHRPHFGSKC